MKDRDQMTVISSLDTRNGSRRTAHEFWQETAGSLYDVSIYQPDEFYAAHSSACFGELFVTHCDSVPQKLSRSNYRIGTDGYDFFEAQFFLEGHWSRQDGKREGQAKPGDVVIQDAAQAHAGSATRFVVANLFIPRPLLAPLLNRPDEQNMRVLTAGEPMVELLRNHVESVWRALPRLRQSQASALARPTAELLAAVMNGSPREDTQAGVAAAQLGEIQRHIEAHILDGDLSPARIAAHYGISARKLAYLFSSQGGVASHIQNLRLDLARRALRNPAQAHRGIAEIGLEYGFVHAHNFTRAFRRRHDMTPREVRATAAKEIARPNRSHGWFERAARW